MVCKDGLGRGVLTIFWPFADAAAPTSCCIFADVSSEPLLAIAAGAIVFFFLEEMELDYVSRIKYILRVHDFAACMLQLIYASTLRRFAAGLRYTCTGSSKII